MSNVATEPGADAHAEWVSSLRPPPADPPGFARMLAIRVRDSLGLDWSLLPGRGIYHHHVVLLWATYVALAACALADRAGREAASKALRRLADRIDREGPAAVRRSVEEGGGRR